MPLTDVANKVEAPQNKDFKPVPEDVYQVVIKDIDEKIMKKFQSEDEEAFYQFKFGILEGGAELQDSSLVAFCSRKWFGGNKKMQPSKLVTLFSAVYGFYYPRMSVIELEAEDITPQVVNDLIGKQLRVMVKLNEDKTGNKVVEFMSIKQELAVPETVKVAAVSKKMVARPGSDEPTTNATHPETQDNPEALPWDKDEKKAGDKF
jgi:hypothetical protein